MTQVYKVITPGPAKAALGELLRKAVQKGMTQAVLAAAQTIGERLVTDPLEFGEPSFRFSALRLIMHTAIVPPLVVSYGVHEELPLVFIKELKSLSRYGLED